MSLSVRVVIPFWEGHAYIEACLASIERSHHQVNEVIVVDNSPSRLQMSARLCGSLSCTVIRCRPSIGFGRACNVGLQYAIERGSDFIILLNQDAKLEPSTVGHLVTFLAANRAFFAAAPLSLDYDGEGISAAFVRMYLAPNTELIQDLTLGKVKESYRVSNKGVNASCLALNVSLLQKTGGFDPIFMMYGEDRELLQRARNDGFDIALLPHARHLHRHSLANEASLLRRHAIQRWFRRGILVTLLKDESRPTMRAVAATIACMCGSYLRCMQRFRLEELVGHLIADLGLVPHIGRTLRHRNRKVLLDAIDQQVLHDTIEISSHSLKLSYNPLVSVIIPCHNREHLVEHALASVLAQTYRPIEVIVVVDGSTDSSAQVVATWIEKHPSTVRLVQIPHGGASHARNVGFKSARGELIQFLDSDDVLHPMKLEVQTAALLYHTEADLCGGDFARGAEVPGDWGFPREYTWLLREAHPTKVFMVWSYLFRRRLLESVGPWNEALPVIQDVELMLRVTRSIKGRIPCIPQPLYFYRQHQESRITANARDHEGIAQRLHALEHIASQPYLSDRNACAALRTFCVRRAPTYFRYGTAAQRAHFHSLFRQFKAPIRERLQMWYIRARVAAQRMRAKGLAGLRG